MRKRVFQPRVQGTFRSLAGTRQTPHLHLPGNARVALTKLERQEADMPDSTHEPSGRSSPESKRQPDPTTARDEQDEKRTTKRDGNQTHDDDAPLDEKLSYNDR
ncbi:MAG: hypothetical protein HC933_19755 [Pleurocapsa sp. SU_196_0]|nr:hypothetical protein [Pleurocapsa sp. SU_196_0]